MFDFISNQTNLASGLGLGLQNNLQICGFYEGLSQLQPQLELEAKEAINFIET
jgi:hypothetical protein